MVGAVADGRVAGNIVNVIDPTGLSASRYLFTRHDMGLVIKAPPPSRHPEQND